MALICCRLAAADTHNVNGPDGGIVHSGSEIRVPVPPSTKKKIPQGHLPGKPMCSGTSSMLNSRIMTESSLVNDNNGQTISHDA